MTRVDPARRIDDDPLVKTLALRAIDAAKAAGATYADVRLTRTLDTDNDDRMMREQYDVGVRALVNGAWGFASSPYWEPEEVVQLAKDAVAQATVNARVATRPVELAKVPPVTGSWVMPVRIDPFTVPIEEQAEFQEAWEANVGQWIRDSYRAWGGVRFFPRFCAVRQERAVANTEGSYFTQTTWCSDARLAIGAAEVKGVGRAAVGWEMLADARIEEQLPELYARARHVDMKVPVKPGDVGRYDAVFDAATMASLVEGSLGTATQLDRALGYEANASGTSYVTDPLGMVGTLQVASPLVTLTADRSTPKSLAWVKWDDEGVEPDTATLVKDGVLADFQTTREMASYLKDYYAKAGRPLRSHGYARSASAADVTMQQMPNLTLQPGKENVSFDDLVKDTKKGMAVMTESFGFDWQGTTGIGGSQWRVIREITNGRLGAQVSAAVPYFNSTELWKSLQVLGGPGSASAAPVRVVKGQPEQATWHTVTIVPAKFTNVAFIDPTRKG